jgi:transposase
MAMTIVETRSITGGVDTHLDVHVAAALDANGGVLGVESFPATTVGFAALHSWLVGFGVLTRIGVEGTGAYGAGLGRFLRTTGVSVIEVDRPNRQARRRAGKSDELDAIEAGRAALSGRASGIAKTADGNVEAIRVLVVAYRSGRDARITCLNQIRHLGFTAPDELRERFQGITAAALAGHAAGLRPNINGDPVLYATKSAMQLLGRRVLDIDADTARLHDQLGVLVRATAPSLLELHGVGIHTAALLLAAAGDNARTDHHRSQVRASLRCRPDPGLVGQDHPIPAQPRRQPASEPCAVADRVHPHEHRRTNPRLRRAASR